MKIHISFIKVIKYMMLKRNQPLWNRLTRIPIDIPIPLNLKVVYTLKQNYIRAILVLLP